METTQQVTSTSRGSAPSQSTLGGNLFQKPLTATLRARGEELKGLQAKRDNLRNKIQSLWARLSTVEDEYWASGRDAIQRYVATHGDGDYGFDHWRGTYAKERSLDARKTMDEQKMLRTQIRECENDLDKLDACFWMSIQSTIDNVAAAPLMLKRLPPTKPTINPPEAPVVRVNKRLRRTQRQTRSLRATRTSTLSSTPFSAAAPAASRPGARYQRSPASPAKSSTPTDPVPAPRRRGKTQPTRPITRPNPSSFQGVTNAAPGRYYQAYYPSTGGDEGWYMGYTLPWDGNLWEETIALQFSMRQIDLKTDWPKCYIPELAEIEKQDEHGNMVADTIVTGIRGWAPGYEDGGPLVQERVFLFLYFDDAHNRKSVKLRVPKRAGGKITFTKAEIASGNVPIDWVPAAYLRPVEVDVGSTVWGRATRKKFDKMLYELGTARRRAHFARCSRTASQDVDDDSRVAWEQSAFGSAEEGTRASTPSQLNGSHQSVDVTLGREIHDNQDSQADVISQPHLSSPMQLIDEKGLSKMPLISPSLTGRLGDSSLHGRGGGDSHSDEGVIMDYDLEVEKSASRKGLDEKESVFGYQQRPYSRLDGVPLNDDRKTNPRGSSTPPPSFLPNSFVSELRAQSVPFGTTWETTR